MLERIAEKWTRQLLSVDLLVLLATTVFDAINLMFDNTIPDQQFNNISKAFSYLLKESLQIILHPTLLNQNLRSEGTDFLKDVASELGWTPGKLKKRIFDIHKEILLTGQYTHTQEELEIGARLAWRNSSKCIGR